MARRVALGIALLSTLALAYPVFSQSTPVSLVTTPGASIAAVTVRPAKPHVGDRVTATASGLTPNSQVSLMWVTVTGGWVVEDYYRFMGKEFVEHTEPLGSATVGADGVLRHRFDIPEDYGGVHDVVIAAGRELVGQGGVEVVPSFSMSPLTGPVGTVVEVRGTGLGWRTMESTWVLNWDNREVGWVSAVDSRGSATARFRATGPLGDHMVKLYTGYMGQSYLNHEQAPTAYLPRPEFVFHTTAGRISDYAYAEPYPLQSVPPAETAPGVSISLDRTQGPVGTPVMLQASGLPASAPVALAWGTWVGNRVSGRGFEPQEEVIATHRTTRGGNLRASVTIPDDLGGLHALAIMSEGNELARTHFAVETSVVGISPRSGPPGTPVSIELKGVGWTEYDNILIATYDNSYMGYACGFNSQGSVTINFTAAGAEGVHLIDLYPGIYKGPAAGQQLYRIPQLTYLTDHPGNRIPAMRFAFEVTGS